MSVTPATDIGPVAWVTTNEDLDHLIEAIAVSSVVVIDLETTGLDEHSRLGGATNGGYPARIVLASLTLPRRDAEPEEQPSTWVLPLSHPAGPWHGRWRSVMGQVARAIVEHRLPVVNQNVKFDSRWVYAHTGVDLSHLIEWDTQISSHLLDENASTRLKERAPATFGIPRWDDDVDLTYPGAAEETDLWDLGEYAARDTYWTWRLYLAHRHAMFLDTDEQPDSEDEVITARLGRVAVWCAMPTVRTLTSIEQRGFRIDVPWVERTLADDVAQRDALLEAMAQRYPGIEGRPSSSASSVWFREWTERAVAAGDLTVAALTPNGRPQWSKAVLTRQARSGSEAAQLVLDQRSHLKRAEYLSTWLDVATPEGSIHTTYHAGRVVTGRLSSSDPNMQQVTKALRPAFIPRPGYVIADLDYSQIELRIAAFISRCQPMIEAYQQGRDLHMIMGGRTSGKAVRGASLSLMQLGLPANGTGAEVLQRVRSAAGVPAYEEVLVRLACEIGSDQDAGSRQRWSAARGVELAVEGGSLATAVSTLPEGLVRALRSDYERFGWPWEWDPDDAGRAPSGLGPFQQRPIELDDALQVVSSLSASQLKRYTDDPWGDYRQQGKAGNFGLIYGMGPVGFRDYAETVYGVSLSDDEAAEVHRAFFTTWDGMSDWHRRVIARAHATGEVTSPIGRVRRLPDIFDGNPSLVSHAERNAINAPVQGFASDLMQMAAASIAGLMPGTSPVPGAALVATVHDSIVVEVDERRWREVVEQCRARMLDLSGPLARMGCELDVPLAAEAAVGTRWGLDDVGTIT